MLFRSLTGRLFGFGILVSVAMLAAAGLLLSMSDRTRQGFAWVAQNEHVIREVDELLADIREAESGQRGYLLTRNPIYLDTFNARIQAVDRRTARLSALIDRDPVQRRRVAELRAAALARVATLRIPLAMAGRGRFDAAIAFVAAGRGRALMEEVARRAGDIKGSEEALLRIRMDEAETRARLNHNLILIGGPLLALAFFLMIFVLVRTLRRPLDGLYTAIQSYGDGDDEARARRSGLLEVDRLARAYNDLADRLSAASSRQAISDAELQAANRELRTRGDAIELLGGMAHRMQASRSQDELADVLRCFLPRVLPDVPGALYVHNNSRNLLTCAASWGGSDTCADSFAPDACWALRRGQGHQVATPGSDVRCGHVDDDRAYHCEPVLAGGEVVGMLYLEGAITAEDRARLAALTENIALALVNQRLQRNLREQSIRDPLTGLFNRRYLEETLALEVARAHRSGGPLGVVMCDVDHFKQFNDRHGHAAGDTVLKSVAAALQQHFRDGDVVCRYGGEEFAIVAPTGDIARLRDRAEDLRATIAGLTLRHDRESLGTVTISLGVAALAKGQSGEALLREADAALYRAKAEGRDRVVVALHGDRLAA